MSARPPPPPPPSLARVPIHGTRVSRTFEPDDPELKKKPPRRFRLKELEQIPKDHLVLYRALHRAMPEALFEPGFTRKLAEVVQRYAGIDIDLWLHSFRIVETNQLRALIPGTTCLLVIGLVPRNEKILIEIDLQFVHRVVQKLLGAKGSVVDIHRPLTEIEQGVFLFVALKVLALANEGFHNPEQLAVRIEDIRESVRAAADVLKREKRWFSVSWKLTFDLDVGVVRALVPDSLARTMLVEHAAPGSPFAERVSRRIRRRFGFLRGTTVDAWIEAGRVELTRSDIAEVGPGDIVLFDEARIALQDGAPGGPAEMRLGIGRHGFLRGVIREQEGQQVFEVQEIVIEEMPPAHDPIEGHGDPDNPEQVVAEYEDGGAPAGYGGDQENHDSSSSAGAPVPAVGDDDAFDEDWGIDDEDDGDDEEYAENEPGYAEGGPAGADEPAPDDNLDQVAPLLGDIPMVLVVELGRVQLTADEVIRLRPGQIIELGRAPSDPVDLVVNGKLVAKGELVEIDGALGVKLLHLVKGVD